MDWFIYNINNLTPQAYAKWYTLMTDEKKSRIDRIRYEDDKKRSIAGEMLAKKSISEFIEIAPENIKISIGENGKPYIEGSPIHFNISHSGNWVMCAVHTEPVGIDIERIKPINLRIAKRFFTTEEQFYVFNKKPDENDFTAPPTDELLKRFFEVWTAKEAYLKFTGKGLCEKLNELNINRKNIDVYCFDDYIASIYTEK